MSKLIAELQRLFFQPGLSPDEVSLASGAAQAFEPLGPDGQLRAMVLGVSGAEAWDYVAALWQEVQDDLQLPAPVMAVTGADGFLLWFSLAEPVPLPKARAFLAGLCRRYLGEVPEARLMVCPPGPVSLVPAINGASGKWSAFIDPSMGRVLAHEPWLDIAPNPERQADLLSNFLRIDRAAFERALMQLAPPPVVTTTRPLVPAELPGVPVLPTLGSTERLGVEGHFGDPKSFLLAVMNDPTASAAHRIDAAKALLPYFP
ncbi:MAG: hypothetical protein JSR69_15760 [Proteobacteria bacterium]|nr:hypothetical protein [Pseudomonadota bacterium]